MYDVNVVGIHPPRTDASKKAAENEKEAQNKCIGAARAKYGTVATVNFIDVDHAGNARHWRDCNRLGFDCKRKCEYVYSKLSCKLNTKLFKALEDWKIATDASYPEPALHSSVAELVTPSHFELAAASFYAGVTDERRREEVVPGRFDLTELRVVADHRATGLRVCLFVGKETQVTAPPCTAYGGSQPTRTAVAAVLAFRGTCLVNRGHLLADYSILKHDTRREELAIAEEAYTVVAELMGCLAAERPGVELAWFATGHSLGGFLAQEAAIRSPAIHRCVVFEAPGCPTMYRGLALARVGPDFWAARVTNYLAVPSPVKMAHAQLGRLVRVELGLVGHVHTLHVVKCVSGTLFRWLNWVLLVLVALLVVELSAGVFAVGSVAVIGRVLARLACVQFAVLACRVAAGLKFTLEAHKLSNMIPNFSRESGLPVAAVEMEVWPESRREPHELAGALGGCDLAHALVPSNTGDSIMHLFAQRSLVEAQMTRRPGYRESAMATVAAMQRISEPGETLRRLVSPGAGNAAAHEAMPPV
eukprot:jgi/Tetstr1/441769/TSEL_029986.t1